MLKLRLNRSLDTLKTNALFRARQAIDHRLEPVISLQNKNLLNFTSNDYLNLSAHVEVKKSLIEAANKFGLGSGSANFVSGYHKSHQALEEAFCEYFNRDKAILFNSGYHANLGVLTSLADHTSTILADKLCHASLIDGILLSRAKHYRYRHNDVEHAHALIQKHPHSLVVTESVFSMQGSITPIKSLISSSTTTIVDDAHGIGVLGNNGKGILEHQNLTQQDIPCLITPLGKAFGSFGAIVSGDAAFMEHILQFSRTYFFSTSLPPAISFATLTSLKIMQQETWRRERLHYLINYFNKGCYERELPLVSDDLTPIRAIIVKTPDKALAIQNHLLKYDIYVSCIRPPTVPKNTSRIRVSLNCSHNEFHIDQLLDELILCLQNT